ncbi:MAG: NPCBM/NEW2 domain-containing protein [Defluviitaleaceae bacterium]|nr:NPCBM/NEW2 domain-containing protein [Defluviitaleaceae bacterium]
MKKLFKRFFTVILALLMVFSAVPVLANQQTIRIEANGNILHFEPPLRIVSGWIIAPIRPVAEAVGATVNWNPYTWTATVIHNNTAVAMQIDNTSMAVMNISAGTQQTVTLEVAPRIYDGFTFLPIEAAARALGLNVNWDEGARILRINSPDFVPSLSIEEYLGIAAPDQALFELQNVLGRDIESFRTTNMQAFSRTNLGMMMGAEYEYGFRNTHNTGSVYFNLGGQWATLSGLFGPLDNVRTGASTTLTIRGDGRVLGTFEVVANDPVQTFTVNVAGVTQLIFTYSTDHWNSHHNFAVANVVVSQSTSAPTRLNTPIGNFEETITLGNQVRAYRLAQTQAFSRQAPGLVMGAEYEYGFRNTHNTGSAYFNINNRYTVMTGVFAPLDNVRSGASTTLTIRGDGRVLATFDVVANDPARTFSVDVTGVSQLIFTYSTDHWNSHHNFAVANVVLTRGGGASAQINQPPLPPQSTEVVLGRDMRAFRLTNAQEFTRNSPGTIMGVEHENGFRNTHNTGSAYFNLNNRHTAMTGSFGPLDNVRSGASTTLTIRGDGRTLATFEVSASDPLRNFTVDVTGVTQLIFTYSTDHWNSHHNFAVVNAVLR